MDTDPEAFIRWALDDARTLEERYTTELVVEQAANRYHAVKQTGNHPNFERRHARQRERYLNPAYQPSYSETSVRYAAEMLPLYQEWHLSSTPGHDRPIRDFAVMRFLPALEKLTLGGDIADLSLLAELPNLRELVFASPRCEDFRPLARCTNLRRLSLSLRVHWPEVAGLENLQQLESLTLQGNLLVFRPGLIFPNVRAGTLECAPLHARSVRDLPQFPACEFLTLAGVERLDGIEALPRLRNLTLTGPVRDLAPLARLPALTCLSYTSALPLDVSPLARAPSLMQVSFRTEQAFGAEKVPPRDYAPLAASSTLRSVHVSGCPPVELEVASLNAALPPWDDFFLLPEPRPVPPLRVIIASHRRHPRRMEPHYEPGEQQPYDIGIRGTEGHWIAKYGTAFVSERLGHPDWGHVDVGPGAIHRNLHAWVECFEDLPRFPLIVDTLRALLAHLRSDYIGHLYLSLRVPVPKPTEALKQLLEQFRMEEIKAMVEQQRRDDAERLERLHLLQLKQQQGEAVNPEEFSPSPQAPSPVAPWEEESDEDEDADEEGSGNFAVKTRPDPPPNPYDDDHPLAANYNLSLTFTLGEVWLEPRHAGLGLHLLQREAADEEIEEEPPAQP